MSSVMFFIVLMISLWLFFGVEFDQDGVECRLFGVENDIPVRRGESNWTGWDCEAWTDGDWRVVDASGRWWWRDE